MKITAILPYFGGKRNFARHIVAEFGEHRAYWELFCGSLAVLFEKPPCSHETVNDLNGDVVNLATVLASDEAPSLYDRLMRTQFCEPLFHDVRGRLRNNECKTEIDRAYCYFVESWMGRNGVAGTRASNTAFCVRFTSNGGDPAMRFRNAVSSIPEWHNRLRGAWILQRNAFDIIDRIEDKSGTLVYADPPYIEKSDKYVHDFSPCDHKRLSESLSRFKNTRVVVSYYEHPLLDELYRGWTKRCIEVTKTLCNQGMRDKGGAVKATEVILINGPSYVAQENQLF